MLNNSYITSAAEHKNTMLPNVTQIIGAKRKSLSTSQADDPSGYMFRVKHHSVGDDHGEHVGMIVAAKNSSISFQDRGRFVHQPAVERTLHSGSANIVEGNF